jgi:hypothetical protein
MEFLFSLFVLSFHRATSSKTSAIRSASGEQLRVMDFRFRREFFERKRTTSALEARPSRRTDLLPRNLPPRFPDVRPKFGR